MRPWESGRVGEWERRRRRLLVVLALPLLHSSTLLLAGCGQRPDPVAETSQVADSADQVMTGVRLYLTNQGVRQAYVEADTAFVYENAGRTELRRVKVTFYRVATGDTTSVLTSAEGTYQSRSGSMEARGNVVVVTSEGARLTTSVLRFDQAKNQVSTDQAYTYDSGERHMEGQGFVSDPSFSNITTQRLRGTGGGFTLPGQ